MVLNPGWTIHAADVRMFCSQLYNVVGPVVTDCNPSDMERETSTTTHLFEDVRRSMIVSPSRSRNALLHATRESFPVLRFPVPAWGTNQKNQDKDGPHILEGFSSVPWNEGFAASHVES